ncbi:MBL fold metallo-hydrolase [Candidatus Woesearchaeota archaeon]|nr:MBL fold metallo-hydrolase [Candidatus Woesearchaeota archaeon]
MKVILLKQGIHEDKMDGNKVVGCTEICGAIILLKSETPEEENIIVDTGNLGYADEIVEKLKENGLAPDEIKYVLFTHRHQDHSSNDYLFKNAVRVGGPWFWNTDKSLDNNGLKAVPGVEIIETPGHVSEHRAVVVKGDKTYVIAGDAIHPKYILDGNYEGMPPNQDYIDSAKKIFAQNPDAIIPGHGPIVEGEKLEELRKAVENMTVEVK